MLGGHCSALVVPLQHISSWTGHSSNDWWPHVARDDSVGQCSFKTLVDGTFQPRLPFLPEGRMTLSCQQLMFHTIVIIMKLSKFHLSQKQVKWRESQFQFFKNIKAASFPEPGRACLVVIRVPFPVVASWGPVRARQARSPRLDLGGHTSQPLLGFFTS